MGGEYQGGLVCMWEMEKDISSWRVASADHCASKRYNGIVEVADGAYLWLSGVGTERGRVENNEMVRCECGR